MKIQCYKCGYYGKYIDIKKIKLSFLWGTNLVNLVDFSNDIYLCEQCKDKLNIALLEKLFKEMGINCNKTDIKELVLNEH